MRKQKLTRIFVRAGMTNIPNTPFVKRFAGNYDTVTFNPPGGNRCSATMNGNNPWWRVDLGSTKRVGTIVILSRQDTIGGVDDLSNLVIRIGDENSTSDLQRNTPIITQTVNLFHEVSTVTKYKHTKSRTFQQYTQSNRKDQLI